MCGAIASPSGGRATILCQFVNTGHNGLASRTYECLREGLAPRADLGEDACASSSWCTACRGHRQLSVASAPRKSLQPLTTENLLQNAGSRTVAIVMSLLTSAQIVLDGVCSGYVVARKGAAVSKVLLHCKGQATREVKVDRSWLLWGRKSSPWRSVVAPTSPVGGVWNMCKATVARSMMYVFEAMTSYIEL